jgi:hypothetical protein
MMLRRGLFMRLSRLERPPADSESASTACETCIEREASRDPDDPLFTWCFRSDESPEREFCPACGALVHEVLDIEFDA